MAQIVEKDAPYVTELKDIAENKAAIKMTFVHADLDEADFGLNELAIDKFPVCVFVAAPMSKNKVGAAHTLHKNKSIYLLLLDAVPGGQDVSSEEAHPKRYKMEQLADNLVYLISKSYLSIGTDKGISDYECVEIADKFSLSLHGVALSFVWNIVTTTDGSYT